MKRFTFLMFCWLLALPAGAASRPNFLVIMADDLGWADLGCYGSEIETPVLDRLAGEGLRFSQFYNTAKCHSSRISLLTGLYPFQAGNTALSKGVTIAETLRPAGYTTLMVGKWHLDGHPMDRGFDRYFGHLSGGCNYFTGEPSFRLDREKFNDFNDFYATTAFADHALNFLGDARKSDQPWMMYLAFNAPHFPLQALEEDYRKYEHRYTEGWDVIRERRQARQRALGLIAPGVTPAPRPDAVPAWDELDPDTRAWEARRMAAYAALVDRMDREIGRIVDNLRASGELDNTVILFCSDNGSCPYERSRGVEHDPWDPKAYWRIDTGWAHVGNTPFRWFKRQQHEGGIRSPLIVHWPAGLKAEAGSITDQPGHLIDFQATLVDLGNATYPEQHQGRAVEPLQGRSLAPIFAGQQRTPHPELYFLFENHRGLRQGDWKVVSFLGGPWELYNIRTDPTELNDLAEAQPERLQELASLWRRYAVDVDGVPNKLLKPVSSQPKAWPYPRFTWEEHKAKGER